MHRLLIRQNVSTPSTRPSHGLLPAVALLLLSLLLWAGLGVGLTESAGALHAQSAPTAQADDAGSAADTADSAAATATSTPQPPLEGTIIANRTDVVVTFFLEGQTYTINPQRSLGVQFPRSTSVLNLYNCAAGTGADSVDCFWDPYLLRQDGFYEVLNGADAGKPVSLLLQDAMTPPGDQIWLHNRTGGEESIYYGGALYELGPGTTTEVVLVGDDTTLYRPNCLTQGGRTVCEWRPQEITGGVYYAMTRVETTGASAGRSRMVVNVAPVLAEDTTLTVAASEPVVTQVSCALNVVTLNVRAGPGVDYLILAKLRQADLGDDTVGIRGRASSGEWLAVDEEIAPGGWISGNASYVSCAGDVTALPVAEISDGRLAPTPVPQVAQPAAAPQPEPEADATPEPEAAAPEPVGGPPPGQVRLIVINAFGQPIRFTYQNAEYDMQAGEQVIIDTFPGLIAFSASSPWRNTSGNADFQMEAGESKTLFVRWEQETAGGSWDLKYD